MWCYKTTKEQVDRIDRKFTQLLVDEHILKKLEHQEFFGTRTAQQEYLRKITEFKKYMADKRKDAYSLKFSDKQKAQLNSEYYYLKKRLEAVEQAIVYFLNRKELLMIKTIYEQEMLKRLVEAREHP